MGSADLLRWIGRGIGQYGQVLIGKFTRHLFEHGPHEIGYFLHLDAPIENETELVLFVNQSAIDGSLLGIGLTDAV